MMLIYRVNIGCKELCDEQIHKYQTAGDQQGGPRIHVQRLMVCT
jgi:hypothetical protein